MPSARSSATAPSPVPKPGARGGDAVTGISLTWQLAGLAVLFLTLAAALIFSGASAARQVSDPGALVRWGLPVAKAVHNVSIATVIGGLIFAVGILPKNLRASRSREKDLEALEHPAFARALAVAAAAGAAWTLSAVAVLVLTYADVAGQGLSGDAEFTRSLVYFMTDIETGKALAGHHYHCCGSHHRALRRPIADRPRFYAAACLDRADSDRADRSLLQLQ
ncbi:hypothetical protein StoSoilB13_25940 [Arthrobacter sp. StoSoilB13]|nr:hypothetical protein StoSoilB13_25940 [Arthrobacter sp. StoSoilB13]